MTTDKPPWKDDTGYNAVKLRIKCNNCGYPDIMSFWLPEVIAILDYSIKKDCPKCNHSDWNVNP